MKKIGIFLVAFSLFFISNVNALEIKSKNAILYNMNDDKVIYDVDSEEKISIASLTKIMTAIVTLENTENLNDTVTLTYKDFKGLEGYATAGFQIGDKVTYYDLLYGLLLPSGADAALSLANHVGGNVDDFVKMMNEKAIELKLETSHFDNPIGEDSKNNYSSVKDVATMLKYALKNSEFKKIYETKKYTTSNDLSFKSTLVTKAKKINKDVSYITGSKTGFTSDAGLCLASTATLNKIDYLLVTCGAPDENSYPYQVLDAVNIYNYYNDNYRYKTLIKKDTLLTTIKVKKSTIKNIQVKSDKDIKVYVNNDVDEEKLEYKYDGKEVIDYTYKVGDKLGVINVVEDGETLYTYDVILEEKITKFPYYIFYILGTVIVLFILFKTKKRKHKKVHKKR